MCMHIDQQYLKSHPNEIFVFGDNKLRSGYGGAASLRDEVNTYGFITKRAPNNHDSSFYRPDEYIHVFSREIGLLEMHMRVNPDKLYLISRLGAGLANKYKIFESVIEPNMPAHLTEFKNVRFLW